jgi:hypothetical protein
MGALLVLHPHKPAGSNFIAQPMFGAARGS